LETVRAFFIIAVVLGCKQNTEHAPNLLAPPPVVRAWTRWWSWSRPMPLDDADHIVCTTARTIGPLRPGVSEGPPASSGRRRSAKAQMARPATTSAHGSGRTRRMMAAVKPSGPFTVRSVSIMDPRRETRGTFIRQHARMSSARTSAPTTTTAEADTFSPVGVRGCYSIRSRRRRHPLGAFAF
jgi:hypothetical protein